MVLFKLLLFTLTFYKFIVDLDAGRSCPKGYRVHKADKNACEKCPSQSYQPETNDAQHCRPCTKCDAKSGSVVKEKCTSETDTTCECGGELVPWDRDSSTCKCTDGYFSVNSHCQKWKECKCGVKMNGTKSSDAICREGCSDASTGNTYTTTPPTSNKMVSLITRLTSRHPHETAHTQRTHTRTTATAAPGHKAIYVGTGMALLILGIIGLLVAVACKLHITPQPAAPKKDSLCRRPVEESGEGSLSSLKLIPGQH